MQKEMPSPEKLDEVQRENLTDEQIEKDKIREDAYEAGKKRGLQEEQLENLRYRVEIMERAIVEKISEMIKKEDIQKGSRVEVILKDGCSFYGEYDELQLKSTYVHKSERDTLNVISGYPHYDLRRFPLEKIESIKRVRNNKPV